MPLLAWNALAIAEDVKAKGMHGMKEFILGRYELMWASGCLAQNWIEFVWFQTSSFWPQSKKSNPKKYHHEGAPKLQKLGKQIIHFLTRPKEYGEFFGSLATDVVHGGTIQPAQLCRFCSRKSLAGLRNFRHWKRFFSVLQNCTKKEIGS